MEHLSFKLSKEPGNQREFEMMIAGNDRKSKEHEPLSYACCFGAYNDSHCTACMDGHCTISVMADYFMLTDGIP